MMPGVDGIELGAVLRQRAPKMHLLLLSSAGPHARDMSPDRTFDAVLAKPVRPRLLNALLGRLWLEPSQGNPPLPSPRNLRAAG